MINDAWKSANYRAEHFLWSVSDRVATITLNRPERKNPLTFESYSELRDLFRRLCYAEDCRAWGRSERAKLDDPERKTGQAAG